MVKKLFEGLYLYNNWDWDKVYPVIHISFGKGNYINSEELLNTLQEFFMDMEKQYNIKLTYPSIKGRFSELIKYLYENSGQKVVVLIDEYDKPILDAISDKEKATQNRETLKNFYSVLKDMDNYLHLVFLTGVSKFSKVSIFSGLNHLNDITISEEFSNICGYTQKELINVFKDRLEGLDLDKIREWYNGYSWVFSLRVD